MIKIFIYKTIKVTLLKKTVYISDAHLRRCEKLKLSFEMAHTRSFLVRFKSWDPTNSRFERR